MDTALTRGMGWTNWVREDDAIEADPMRGEAAAEANARRRLNGPPSVLRGAKHEGEEGWIVEGIHCLRMTGPEDVLPKLMEWVVKEWGDGCNERPGMSFFARSLRWEAGPIVQMEHNTMSLCMVIIEGKVLEQFTPEERVQMLRELIELGMKASRIDLALDLVGEHVELVERVEDAIRDGELCGPRRWKPNHEYNRHQVRLRSEVTMGRRGKEGSGRYVRVYDKGLEQGEEANRRHRWELECNGYVAAEVATLVAFAGEWEQRVREIALGAVDFRIGTARRALAERPRAAWWAILVDGIETLRVTVPRRTPSLDSTAAWFRQQVFPTLLAISEVMGDLGEAVSLLGAGRVTRRQLENAVRSPTFSELSRYLDERACRSQVCV